MEDATTTPRTAWAFSSMRRLGLVVGSGKSMRYFVFVPLLPLCLACTENKSPPPSQPIAQGDNETLYKLIATGAPEHRDAAIRALHASLDRHYGYFVIDNPDGTWTLVKNPDTLPIVGKAVPKLIEALKGPEARKAHSIMTGIQPDCPPPDYEIWRRWWEEKGKKWYEYP